MVKSTINNKLEVAINQSLQAEKKSKKTTKKPGGSKNPPTVSKKEYEQTMETLEIPKNTRKPEVSVYVLTYHNRARLDHVRFPSERMHDVVDSPMFATYAEADAEARRREAEDKQNFYFTRTAYVKVDQVPPSLLKKLKERGWGFHN